MLKQYPVLGICGRSGAGKTTLIEALIPLLRDLGLQVAVVKDGAHRVQVDVSGKDSDRFFRAGADVALLGEQHFIRSRQQTDLTAFLVLLCSSYDVVLVEGHAATAVPKIWLTDSGPLPDNQGHILAVLNREQATVERVFSLLQTLIANTWRQTPVWGCVLIGGKSSRMGQPKHLLQQNGKTWLELTVDKMAPQVAQVVISGSGQIPASLTFLPRVPDVPGLAGPLAGILSVMRWQPAVSWLVTACDLPDVQPASLQWLLEQRQPGMRAILPDLHGKGRLEPLLAWYDFRCRPLLEKQAASNSLRLSTLAEQVGVCALQPPAHLHSSWRNVNTPEELLRSSIA
ncbi:molybdopterin-guanine dinucleotide biosynthesis protein B [Candidatus Electronema sp. PJ]|uniref:molybdopterin-guanine dinucleotide biosynthesis protein B n=1 Tax=Candidatus Electronema sp. PJ TaxID=3401572 RepID=UPI003AA987EA